MRRPPVLLVDGSGQPFAARVADAALAWLPRLRAGFPTLDDTACVEVLEEAARRIVRRESGGHVLEHLYSYAWTAIRSAAISRTRLGRERVVQLMADRQRPEAGARPRAQAVTAADVEARVLLSQLLDQLTSLERRIFRLKAAGFSTREIALRVSRAPTTVDSVHSRSMVRLRALWTARPGVPAPRLGTDRGRQ